MSELSTTFTMQMTCISNIEYLFREQVSCTTELCSRIKDHYHRAIIS